MKTYKNSENFIGLVNSRPKYTLSSTQNIGKTNSGMFFRALISAIGVTRKLNCNLFSMDSTVPVNFSKLKEFKVKNSLTLLFHQVSIEVSSLHSPIIIRVHGRVCLDLGQMQCLPTAPQLCRNAVMRLSSVPRCT